MRNKMDKNKYYLGTLCKRKHNYQNTNKSLRYINSGECFDCNKMRCVKYREEKKDKILEYKQNRRNLAKINKTYLGKLCKYGHEHGNTGKALRYYNGGGCVVCMRIRQQSIKVKKYKQKWNKEHKEQNNIHKRNYQKKQRETNPQYRVNRNISKAIWYSLVGTKNELHWENLVGYTLKDLTNHLEKQFTNGMTWENYGKWHIDHKIPKNVFNFTTHRDIDFNRCWALSNLQPMWASENMSKGAKLEKDFQPSLAF